MNRPGRRLVVDWPRCRGHGACAQALPELIGTDRWGFPVVPADPVPAELTGHARRALTSCPEQALRLVASRAQTGRTSGRPEDDIPSFPGQPSIV